LNAPRRTAGLVYGARRTYHGKVTRRGSEVEPAQSDIRSALAKPPPPERERETASHNQPAAHDGEDLEYEAGIAKNDSLGKQKYEQKLEATVRKQLEHFTDPFHIANYVATALQKGRFDEALLLARRASRNKKVEVTWNHLIDYQMKNRRLHAAVKLYNEVRTWLSCCSRHLNPHY
jgi:pentatricopeptide repeat protein